MKKINNVKFEQARVKVDSPRRGLIPLAASRSSSVLVVLGFRGAEAVEGGFFALEAISDIADRSRW